MGLFVLCVVLLFAALVITRAGALLLAVAAGWAVNASGAPLSTTLVAGVIAYVAAGLMLRAWTEHEGWIGRAGHWFAIASSAVAFGGLAFLIGNDGGGRIGIAALFGVMGAFAGGALAHRHYRTFT